MCTIHDSFHCVFGYGRRSTSATSASAKHLGEEEEEAEGEAEEEAEVSGEAADVMSAIAEAVAEEVEEEEEGEEEDEEEARVTLPARGKLSLGAKRKRIVPDE